MKNEKNTGAIVTGLLVFLFLFGLFVSIPARAQSPQDLFNGLIKKGLKNYNKQKSRNKRRSNSRRLKLSRGQVFQIQNRLNALGYNIGRPTGNYGPKTRRAVRRYQAASGYPKTGYLTANQANLLLTGTIHTDNAQSPAHDETPLTRAQTRKLQSALNRLGYNVGRADGKAGRKTGRALSRFLRKKGHSPETTSPNLALKLVEAQAYETARSPSAPIAWTKKKSPELDCRKAQTDIELAICANPALKQLDNELNQAYAHALQSGNRSQVKAQQRGWIKNYRKSCAKDIECLTSLYHVRISSLSIISASSGQ